MLRYISVSFTSPFELGVPKVDTYAEATNGTCISGLPYAHWSTTPRMELR
jgi:hypothetical protein